MLTVVNAWGAEHAGYALLAGKSGRHGSEEFIDSRPRHLDRQQAHLLQAVPEAQASLSTPVRPVPCLASAAPVAHGSMSGACPWKAELIPALQTYGDLCHQLALADHDEIHVLPEIHHAHLASAGQSLVDLRSHSLRLNMLHGQKIA